MTQETMSIIPPEILRYQEYRVVCTIINGELREAKLNCPVHGKWQFRRIGETNQFLCCHSDHQGKKADGSLMHIDGKPCNK